MGRIIPDFGKLFSTPSNNGFSFFHSVIWVDAFMGGEQALGKLKTIKKRINSRMRGI